MKKLLHFLMSAVTVCVVVSCSSYDDSPINQKLDDIDRRVTVAENQVKAMTSDITAILALLEAQKNDLRIARLVEISSGYILIMTDGSQIVINQGRDGRDGQDGKDGKDGLDGKDGKDGTDGKNGLDGADGLDGKDGVATVIGVEKVGDMYYWTITVNGVTTFIFDEKGNRIPAMGRDGRDGADGHPGKDGRDGVIDAVKLMMRVDAEGYLQISADRGQTWLYIFDDMGDRVMCDSSGAPDAIADVYIDGDYYVFVLANGTIIRLRSCECNASGVPADSQAGYAPDFPDYEINAVLPNISGHPGTVNGTYVYNIDITGIQDPVNGGYLSLYGTNDPKQNIWVDVDNDPKGLLVVDESDEEYRAVDLVFLVDNSGSMSEEADAIARDIIAWANSLSQAGLDIRFGCVGYDGNLTGALNLTTAANLSAFLNQGTGTSRTAHFGGPDASTLQSLINPYKGSSMEENGVAPLRYADKYFSFRPEANRIYVNFTDENNEVLGRQEFSVETLKTNWNTNQGTVHTVFSGSKPTNRPGVSENPWLMSEYTGGTVIFTSGSFSGVSLESLPVTGSMKHSARVRISSLEKKIDGQSHELRITVMSPDRRVKARRSYSVVF